MFNKSLKNDPTTYSKHNMIHNTTTPPTVDSGKEEFHNSQSIATVAGVVPAVLVAFISLFVMIILILVRRYIIA